MDLTPQDKSILTTLATTPRLPEPLPEADDPPVLHHGKYATLFEKILSEKKKETKHYNELESEKVKDYVKNAIMGKLDRL